MIPFCKFHGFGNDYIVLEKDRLPSGASLAKLAVAMCERSTGVGADGIAVLAKLDSQTADYFCEIVNPNGTIAGFSGNGTRCAAGYLNYKKLWAEPVLRLETRSGLKRFKLLEDRGDGSYRFEAEIGKPRFASGDIPTAVEPAIEFVDGYVLATDQGQVTISAVNVGNPVAAIFIDTFPGNWREIGRAVESHPAFPERTNVVFVKVLSDSRLEVRIWERGAGETSSSGTCSTAAAVLAAKSGRTGRVLSVAAPGGVTEVEWRENDEIVLTGRTELAFLGEWPDVSSY